MWFYFGVYLRAAELQMLGLLRPASNRRGDQVQKLVFPYVPTIGLAEA